MNPKRFQAMNAKWTPLCAGAVLLVALLATSGAQAERITQRDIPKLPIGHKEITEVEEGKYRVIARVVEAGAMIEHFAELTGNPIEFETEINTYWTNTNPTRARTPQEWLDFIATQAGKLHVGEEDGAWRVYTLALDPRFDASLSEEDIVAEYAQDLAGMSVPHTGIETGLVFHRGALIPPPYQVDWVIAPDGVAEIRVNGVTVERRTPIPAPQQPTAADAPELPDSGQFEEREDLRKFVHFRLYPELLSERSQEEALAEVVDFVAGQEIVEEIVTYSELLDKEFDPFKGELMIRWAGQDSLTELFYANYDINTGSIRGMGPPEGRSAEERAKEAAEEIEGRLADDRVLVFGRTTRTGFSAYGAAGFAEYLTTAKDLPLLQAEAVIAEALHQHRPIARELAANLRGDYDRAIEKLEAIAARFEEARR